MFSNLFFVILNLLLISTVLDQTSLPAATNDPGLAFEIFIFCFALLLPLIYWQSSWLQNRIHLGKERTLLLINFELLAFLSAFYFFLEPQHWVLGNFGHFGATIFSLFSLLLYLLGIFTAQLGIESMRSFKTAFYNAWMSISFLFPFVIPFFALTLLGDLNAIYPFEQILTLLSIPKEGPWYIAFLTVLNLSIIVSTLVLLPPLAVLIWQCPRLKDPELKKELDALCRRANFKHGGFRIWEIMNNAMTAAIIGVVGKLRYVLFTQKLLNHVPQRAIVAILAHEIGHSYHKHLFFYPFILMGMIIAASLSSVVIYIPLMQSLNLEDNFPSAVPLLIFLLFGLTMAIYFRYVFGYFSRIFERQADLHVFKLDVPAADMIEALDMLAVSAGNIHNEPNWHHFSIQQRIDLLKNADRNRSLIERHAKVVRLSLLFYFFFLVVCSVLMGISFYS